MKSPLLVLLISILLTTFLWISLDLYHSYVESFLPTLSQQSLEPINPNFDISVMGQASQPE